jgi:hypothetical protein
MKVDHSQAVFMILFLGVTAILPYPHPFRIINCRLWLYPKMKQAEAAISLQSEAVPVAVVSFFAFSARWLRSRLVFSPSFGY